MIRRIDDVIIKTFALCFFKMAESFENLDDILPDWGNEDLEKRLAEAVDSYVKQGEERKSCFSVGCCFFCVCQSCEIWNKKAFFPYILIIYCIKQIHSILLSRYSLLSYLR